MYFMNAYTIHMSMRHNVMRRKLKKVGGGGKRIANVKIDMKYQFDEENDCGNIHLMYY